MVDSEIGIGPEHANYQGCQSTGISMGYAAYSIFRSGPYAVLMSRTLF
jgi:hypothetical protein